MQKLSSALALALLATTAIAQGGPFDPFGLPAPRAWKQAIEAGTRSADGRPGERYWTDRTSYRIEVEIDPATARVHGRAVLGYENRSGAAIETMWLHLRQNLHRAGARRTRVVEVTDGFELESLKVAGEPVEATVDGTLLRLPLKQGLAPDATLEIEIAWSFRVPEAGRAPRMGHEDHGVFHLAYWYPQFAMHEDVRGWVTDQYLGNGEFYMGFADYDVAVTVPQGFLVRATGDLQNPEEVLAETTRARLAEAMSTDSVVHVVDAEDLAAGKLTASSESGKLTWRFQARQVRDFVLNASSRYVWDAARARTGVAVGEGEPTYARVDVVYEPGAGREWQRAADYARHTVEWASARLYPYPWPHLTVCEGIIGGSGMEYPMMTLIGGARRRPEALQSILGHEIIHMWFPMIVGQNEKRWSWMDEGITSFVEDFEASAFFGREVVPARVARAYRGFAPLIEEESSMIHADRFGADLRAYQIVTYSKPAAAFHQLRMILGDDLFWRALRTYVERWAFKHPWPQDLANTFSDVAGQNLDWYFRTWFRESWTLDQAAAEIRDEGERSVVVIENRGDAIAPTLLEVELEDGTVHRKTIPVDTWMGGATSTSVAFPGRVVRAEVDPDRWALDSVPDNDRLERTR